MRRCLNCMELYDERYGTCPVCGYQGEEPNGQGMIRPAGEILQGRYILGTLRRSGRTDLTYIGWDNLFARKVLIQEFFPPRLAKRGTDGEVLPREGMEEAFRQNLSSFVRSRRQLILLYDQPDILSVYSCFEESGTGFATFQYSDASLLSDYVEEQGPLGPGEAMRFLEAASRAVARAHAAEVVHGAVGPDSFFVTSVTRDLVLTGFAEPCHSCGDPSLPDFGHAGSWTDVRGLSLLFAGLLDGRTVDQPKEAEQIISRNRKWFSPKIIETLLAGLADNPEDRIRTVAAFTDGIFLEDTPTVERTTEERADGRNSGNPIRNGSRESASGRRGRAPSGRGDRQEETKGRGIRAFGKPDRPAWFWILTGAVVGCAVIIAVLGMGALFRKEDVTANVSAASVAEAAETVPETAESGPESAGSVSESTESVSETAAAEQTEKPSEEPGTTVSESAVGASGGNAVR